MAELVEENVKELLTKKRKSERLMINMKACKRGRGEKLVTQAIQEVFIKEK